MQVIFRARQGLFGHLPAGSARRTLITDAASWFLKKGFQGKIEIDLSDYYTERKSVGVNLDDRLVAAIDKTCQDVMTRTDWLHWAVLMYVTAHPKAVENLPKPQPKVARVAKVARTAKPAKAAKAAKAQKAKNGAKKTSKAAPKKTPSPVVKPAPKTAPNYDDFAF